MLKKKYYDKYPSIFLLTSISKDNVFGGIKEYFKKRDPKQLHEEINKKSELSEVDSPFIKSNNGRVVFKENKLKNDNSTKLL